MTEKLDWKELDALSKEFFEIAEGHSYEVVLSASCNLIAKTISKLTSPEADLATKLVGELVGGILHLHGEHLN